jgi:hypothetical protein
VKIRSLEKGNPDSDIRKNPSVELSITVGMVYHNVQKGANHFFRRNTLDNTRGLKFFLHSSENETIDKLFLCEIHMLLRPAE